MMERIKQTFWLVFCVLLIYQQPASIALSFSLPISNGITDPEYDFDDASGDSCLAWEEYDGTACVCASDTTARCTDEGGMVCDNKGRQYVSQCYFSLEICQQNVSLDTTVASCGGCDTLRLHAHGKTFAKFQRIGQDTGLKTRYRALTDDNAQVFFVNELGAWAVGYSNGTGSYIRMVQALNSSYPEEGNPGMLIPLQNGTRVMWELDSSYRLECVKDMQHGSREKRFIFALIAGITIAVTATTTTLHVVQATKGCLYYPSVCSMRDEIKNKLLPETIKKKDQFLSTFGEPKQFKAVVDKIHDQIIEIEDKIVSIPKLHTSINTSFSSLLSLYSSLRDDFPDIKAVLSDYNDWVENIMKSASQQLAMLPLDITMSMMTLVAETATSIALAASIIGGVLAFAFAIVDVVSSVLEEKKVRDQLKEKKNELVHVSSQIDSAFSNMHSFQKKFCQYVVKFFYDFSNKGKTYDSKFRSLFNFISRTYGDSPNRCNDPKKVAKSNRATLSLLSTSYLQPLLNVLTNSIDDLKRKIHDIEETKAFLNVIRAKVFSNSSPFSIFDFIKGNKPRMTNKMYHNLFDLLRFISKSIIPNKSCYWGQDLSKIRLGLTTSGNYMKMPVCQSPEIDTLSRKIKEGVQNQVQVCKIDRQIHGKVFRDKFRTIRYIADFILPNQKCYWGYDLEDIRGTPNEFEINHAKVDSNLLKTLQNLHTAAAEVPMMRQILQGQFGITTDRWQDFIMCHVIGNSLKGITCPTMSSGCFPSNPQYVSC